MRYVPSTRVGSMMMGAVRQAARDEEVAPELAQQAIDETLTCLEIHETGVYRGGEFWTTNCKMSSAFLDWAHALEDNDPAAVQAARAKLDALADAHPFSYHRTRAIYEAHHKYFSYDVSRDNYRAWDEKNPHFAVVDAKLNADARIAIIGDWGTGEPDANALIRDVLTKNPDVILHLGDVYDAGLPVENEEHFLKPIQDACDDLGMPLPPILTLPGNHEYYSGAVGYFHLIDVLNRVPGQVNEWKQEASFFCLRSADDKWQFLGADSGLGCIEHPDCPQLQHSEIKWHRERIREFPGKTIFMTHHQFVSAGGSINHHASDAYRYINRHFVEAFDVTIPGHGDTYLDRIELWLWGHAHWFVPFRPNLKIPTGTSGTKPLLKRGQLLGGSAREKTTGGRGVNQTVQPWVLHQGDLDPTGKAPEGDMILPGAKNSAGSGESYYNHTYAIIELGTQKVHYHEFPSWTDKTRTPDKSPIRQPLLSLDLIVKKP